MGVKNMGVICMKQLKYTNIIWILSAPQKQGRIDFSVQDIIVIPRYSTNHEKKNSMCEGVCEGVCVRVRVNGVYPVNVF